MYVWMDVMYGFLLRILDKLKSQHLIILEISKMEHASTLVTNSLLLISKLNLNWNSGSIILEFGLIVELCNSEEGGNSVVEGLYNNLKAEARSENALRKMPCSRTNQKADRKSRQRMRSQPQAPPGGTQGASPPHPKWKNCCNDVIFEMLYFLSRIFPNIVKNC